MAEMDDILTIQGKKDLEDELEHLIKVDQVKANEELNFARSQGDLSENSDYDVAKEKTAKISARIAQIKHILDHAKVIEAPIDNSLVSVGGGVVKAVRTDTGDEFTFKIVGSQEADPVHNKISNASPVAQALVGHKVGDVCLVKAKISYSLKIVDIQSI